MIVGLPLAKQSSEVDPLFAVTFEDRLGVDETVISAVFSAVMLSDGSDATSELSHATIVVASPLVTQTLKGGAHGENYMLQITATTSLGHVWEAERQLIVRDIPVPTA